MGYSCIISIDNSSNTYPLELQNCGTNGNFSPSVPPSIAPKQVVTLTLTPKSLEIDASALLVWNTGASNASVITMAFENGGIFGSGNNASLTVEGAVSDYGVSYFYASSGAEAPMARDYINDMGGSPVYVDFHIVFNEPLPEPLLPGITNVVMVMLENRSLDHLMGQLYTNAPGDLPANIYPPGGSADYNGLPNPAFSNTANNVPVTVFPVTGTLNVPDPDPGEGWLNTNQQLFNITGTPQPGATPNMGGFLANYAPYAAKHNADPNQIMQFYTPADLPVISTLAKSYAVSDAWFCSVPSQTMPNRSFSLTGTSCGYVDNISDGSNDILKLVHYKTRTIFNLLKDCGNNNWAIFSPEFNRSYLYNPATVYFFDQVKDILYSPSIEEGTWPYNPSDESFGQSPQNQSLDNFLYLCENGTLPALSYVEPSFYYDDPVPHFPPFQDINGSDYHPPANLCPGEAFLAVIYNALTKYKDWNTTLLIVTFDEHGGCFDHVPPPATIAPDEMTDWSGFTFERLGLRVPTLLISPTIAAGTAFRSPDNSVPFDHTSFVRTIMGWQGIDISGGAMGARAAQAPDFSGVITPTPEGKQPVNPGAVTLVPNPACANISDPLKPPGAAQLNDLQKAFLPFVAQSITKSKPGTAEHQQVLNELQSINTVGELKDYVKTTRAERQ